jgi:hypothetical protein
MLVPFCNANKRQRPPSLYQGEVDNEWSCSAKGCRPLEEALHLSNHEEAAGSALTCSLYAQIQGLEDMLGSFQGAAVDGVPAELSAGVPHAAQTYTRIIARARNEAGGRTALANAERPSQRGLRFCVCCAYFSGPHLLRPE